MRKRKPLIINNYKVEWIGPLRPNKKHIGYLRIEDEDEIFILSPNDKQLRKIYGWLKYHFSADRKAIAETEGE